MPGNDPPLDYLDACVLLAYVEGEEGRASVVDGLFQDVLDGQLRLCTSVLSVVEVAYVASDPDTVDDDIEDDDLSRIDELWTPASPIVLVDMSEVLARRARGLIRAAKSDGWGLKPPDATHLASAVLVGARHVLTYEHANTRRRWADLIGLPVEEPVSDRLPLE